MPILLLFSASDNEVPSSVTIEGEQDKEGQRWISISGLTRA